MIKKKEIIAASTQKQSFLDAVSRISPGMEWLSLSVEEKSAFEKARFAVKQSKTVDFVLGGPVKHIS